MRRGTSRTRFWSARALVGTAVAAAMSLTLMACGAGASASIAVAKKTTREIAFFGYSNTNTFTVDLYDGIAAAAKKYHLKSYFFSSNTSSTTQLTQLTDAIASGTYQIFVVTPDDGAAVVQAVKNAVADHITVVGAYTPLGPNLNTTSIQIPGVTGDVSVSIQAGGVEIGKLMAEACKGVNPCRAEYMPGDLALPLETARTDGVDSVLKKYTNIVVEPPVAAGYTPSTGEVAVADVLTTYPNLNVLAGTDQAIYGGVSVLKARGLLKTVKLIGDGGTYQAIAGIKNGTWFGDFVGCPYYYGYDAATIAIKVRLGQSVKDRTPNGANACHAPADLTKANVGKFKPEWSAA